MRVPKICPRLQIVRVAYRAQRNCRNQELIMKWRNSRNISVLLAFVIVTAFLALADSEILNFGPLGSGDHAADAPAD
jgi:hypothetical protein